LDQQAMSDDNWWHDFQTPDVEAAADRFEYHHDNPYDNPFYEQGVYDSKHRGFKPTPVDDVPLGPPRKKNVPGLLQIVANIKVQRREFDTKVRELHDEWDIEDEYHEEKMKTFREIADKMNISEEMIDKIEDTENVDYANRVAARKGIYEEFHERLKDAEMVAFDAQRALDRTKYPDTLEDRLEDEKW
jgi:hypothetical protein